MRKPSLKKIIAVITFFLVIFVSSAVLRPIYNILTKQLNVLVDKSSIYFNQKTGLSISYNSLSPSIFTGLRIKNIVLKDSFDDSEVLSVNEILMKYNVIDFIRGKSIKAIKDVTIDGFTFSFSQRDDFEVLKKLSELAKSFSKDTENNTTEVIQDDILNKPLELLNSFEKWISLMPFNVSIKNVNLNYYNEVQSINARLKKIFFTSTPGSQIMFKTSGAMSYYRIKEKYELSCAFSADGTLSEVIEGTSINMHLSDVTDKNYILNRLNILLGFKNNLLEVRTFQNNFPFYFYGSYDFEKQNLAVNLKSDRLKTSSLVSAKKNGSIMNKIKNIELSMQTDILYSGLDKKINYKSEGECYIPEELYKDSCSITYSFIGDSDSFSINSLKAVGQNIDVDISGSYEFKNIKVSGLLGINYLVLPNGGIVSTEIFIDPLKSGFMAFAPQLMLDEKVLTALQLNVVSQNDSVDFMFEVSDYDHIEAEEPGILKIDGSYIKNEKFLQAGISSSRMYLDSFAKTASFFTEDRIKSEFAFLKNYVFNGDLFVQYTAKTLSFDVPYAFIANTKKEDQFIFLSLDGNNDSINVSRFDFLSKGNLIHSSGSVGVNPDGSDAFFLFDLNANSIPYQFSGNLMKNIVTVQGDYNFFFNLDIADKKKPRGQFSVANFPIKTSKTMISLSTDSVFSYSKDNGIDIRINSFEGHETGDYYSFSPLVLFSGNISKYGFFINDLSYSDKFSSLTGDSTLLWSLNDGVFESANFSFNLKNPLSSESLSLTSEFSNPDREPFSKEAVFSSFFMTTQLSINSFGLNRFTLEQSENNFVSATIIASGVLENPYIGIDIDTIELMTAGKLLNAKGSAFVEEKYLKVEDFKFSYDSLNVSDVKMSFNLSDFTGNASAVLDTVAMKQTVHMPLIFSVSDSFVPKDSFLPSEFAATLECKEISGSLFTKKFPFFVTILRSSDSTSIFTGEEQGISGSISNDGLINFSTAQDKPLQFNLTGDISGNGIKAKLASLKVDIGTLFNFVNIPKLKIYNGLLRGNIDISGLKSDPDFMGSLSLTSADFTLPKIVSQHVTIPKALMIINHNVLEMPETKGFVKKDIPIFSKLKVFFNGWSFERLEADIYNPKNVYIPGDFEIRLARFVGDANLDLKLILEDRYLDVTGDVFVKNLDSSVKTQELGNLPPKRNIFIRSDLNIHFGQHVSFMLDPLIRAVIVPDTDFNFKYDMEERALDLDGELAMRSGDISYLSRNFYLKRGTMKFNKKDPSFNPLVNLQAETRERDTDGNEIRIIMNVTNQYLLNFTPKFSSIPAKSENEIRTLLGQIAVGDSSDVRSLLFATGDYAIQSTIGRSIENKLRDFLNFDILSVRTNVLQNALNYNLSKDETVAENSKNPYGVGNFFDNSTVYFGKYLGSSIYVDSMMRWAYDDIRVEDDSTINGLVFKPEIGLEIESPFGNIRWDMTPDFNSLRNDRFVSTTSVTLSWKFSL